MMAATVITIPIDIIVIPWCQQLFGNGAMGGSISYIITEMGMTVAGLLLLPKGTINKSNVWTAARILLSGLLMIGGVWWVRNFFIAIPILTGAVTYLLSIYLLRVITPEDWTLFRRTAYNGFVRFRTMIRPQTAIE